MGGCAQLLSHAMGNSSGRCLSAEASCICVGFASACQGCSHDAAPDGRPGQEWCYVEAHGALPYFRFASLGNAT